MTDYHINRKTRRAKGWKWDSVHNSREKAEAALGKLRSLNPAMLFKIVEPAKEGERIKERFKD